MKFLVVVTPPPIYHYTSNASREIPTSFSISPVVFNVSYHVLCPIIDTVDELLSAMDINQGKYTYTEMGEKETI